MMYKKCPKCEVNYIPQDAELCAVCSTREVKNTHTPIFDSGYNVQYLNKKGLMTYKEVEDEFGIKIAYFGKGINPTYDSVVLISSIEKNKDRFVYHDHWTKEGDCIYYGEGKTYDQTFTKGNKAIIEAEKDNKKLYLFIKFSPSEYYFQGEFKLVKYTYKDQLGEDDKMHKQFAFQLMHV